MGYAVRGQGQSSKGGSGTTYLASNLAHALATQEGKRVLIIDLNLPFGEVELYLSDQRAKHSLADVAGELTRLDSALLRTMVMQVTPNLAVLPAPAEPERSIEITPDAIEQILSIAVGHYDVVLLDVPANTDPVTVRALDKSDLVFVVMQETVPFVRRAARLQGLLRNLGYAEGKVQFVLNRHNPQSEISRGAIERTLGMRIAHTIPNSFRTASTAINQGRPAAEINRKDPVVRAIHEMARHLTALLARRRTAV